MNLILSRIFRRYGFEVQVALDGRNGIKQALSQMPDVILLDIVMPGMDGVEVARRLRNEPRCAGIPIIFLTAFSPAIGQHEVKAVAADGFVSKPFAVDELVDTVQAFTGPPGDEPSGQ
jgi:CheY-like chemotaxis protein